MEDDDDDHVECLEWAMVILRAVIQKVSSAKVQFSSRSVRSGNVYVCTSPLLGIWVSVG